MSLRKKIATGSVIKALGEPINEALIPQGSAPTTIVQGAEQPAYCIPAESVSLHGEAYRRAEGAIPDPRGKQPGKTLGEVLDEFLPRESGVAEVLETLEQELRREPQDNRRYDRDREFEDLSTEITSHINKTKKHLLSAEDQEELSLFLKEIVGERSSQPRGINALTGEYYDTSPYIKPYYVEVGSQAYVIKVPLQERVYKVTLGGDNEVRLLRKLKEKHGKLENIVELIWARDLGHDEQIKVMALEYIEGPTLLKLVNNRQLVESLKDYPRKKSTLFGDWNLSSSDFFTPPPDLEDDLKIEINDVDNTEALKDSHQEQPVIIHYQHLTKYFYDIFKGLVQMKACNIFHRDISLGNLMVDTEHDRGVIIDLGIATDNPEDQPQDNRRYGGDNDLISLGQIMYRFYVGRHLFHPASIWLPTNLIPDVIKAERKRDYEDKTLLENKLEEVRTKVPHPSLAIVIERCLRASGTDDDYARINSAFLEYFDSPNSIAAIFNRMLTNW